MRRHDRTRRHSRRKSTPGGAGQASAEGEAKHARLKGSGCVCSCRRLQPPSPSRLLFLLLLLLLQKLIVLVERNVLSLYVRRQSAGKAAVSPAAR